MSCTLSYLQPNMFLYALKSHSFILYSVLEEELTEGLVEPVPAVVESESNYVATFESVQDDLNSSTIYSIDSYMGDIGENQFNSCTNPCIVSDKPCNSFDGVSKSLIPPIFDTLSLQPTLQNDPVYLTRESPKNSNISLSIFSFHLDYHHPQQSHLVSLNFRITHRTHMCCLSRSTYAAMLITVLVAIEQSMPFVEKQ